MPVFHFVSHLACGMHMTISYYTWQQRSNKHFDIYLQEVVFGAKPFYINWICMSADLKRMPFAHIMARSRYKCFCFSTECMSRVISHNLNKTRRRKNETSSVLCIPALLSPPLSIYFSISSSPLLFATRSLSFPDHLHDTDKHTARNMFLTRAPSFFT